MVILVYILNSFVLLILNILSFLLLLYLGFHHYALDKRLTANGSFFVRTFVTHFKIPRFS